MKVNIHNNRLLIEPETDFETEWLVSSYQKGGEYSAWLKFGNTPAHLIGMIIDKKPITKSNKDQIDGGDVENRRHV